MEYALNIFDELGIPFSIKFKLGKFDSAKWRCLSLETSSYVLTHPALVVFSATRLLYYFSIFGLLEQ